VILASVAACVYFVFLCVMVGRALINIYSKRSLLATMSKARRKYYKVCVQCSVMALVSWLYFKITFKPRPKQIKYNNVFLFSLSLSFVDYSFKEFFY